MTIPDPITRYYAAAEGGDVDAVVACFATEASVEDDGRSYHGHAEIRRWREDLASAFTYTTQITGVEQVGERGWVVQTHIEGDFPGGVVDLRQRFTLDGELISTLAI